jgi:hypothetical protein
MGSSWLGTGAAVIAFVVLLPLREQRMPLERLAEIRGRSARTQAVSTRQVHGPAA